MPAPTIATAATGWPSRSRDGVQRGAGSCRKASSSARRASRAARPLVMGDAAARSLRADACVAHHAAPLLGLGGEVLGELLRRAAERARAHLGEALLHSRVGE